MCLSVKANKWNLISLKAKPIEVQESIVYDRLLNVKTLHILNYYYRIK